MKIKQRQEMAVMIGRHGEPGRVHSGKHFEKLEAAVNGEKPGIFAKHDYRMITRGVSRKTKPRMDRLRIVIKVRMVRKKFILVMIREKWTVFWNERGI